MNSKTDISNWERHCSLVENLRDVELPPVWLPAGRQRSGAEQGNLLFESGRQRVMASHAISLLERAEYVAVISSFLLADQAIEDAIVEAAGRGVRVYILLASEARLGREAGDGEFERKVLEQHKAMLNRLAGHALFRSASHFHAKVVLADPFDDLEPQGMLLTANLTTEALERNEELGVQLLPDEVLEMASYLRWAMWESAEHEMVDPKDRFKAVKALGEVKHPAATTAVVATTAGSNTLRQEILRLICEAREQIIVSSFGWDAEHEVVKLLCARAQAGLQVIVLARVRPAAMPALIALAKAGAVVYAFNWLHAKAIWTDRRQGLLMSANLQQHGLDQGFELGLCLHDGRVAELHERLRGWIETAPWVLKVDAQLGAVSGRARLWNGKELREVDVQLKRGIDLGSVDAVSAELLEARQPAIPKSDPLQEPVHEVHYHWVIKAPCLHARAQEQYRAQPETESDKAGKKDRQPSAKVPYSPPVYRQPQGELVVAITDASQMAAARKVQLEVKASRIVLKGER